MQAPVVRLQYEFVGHCASMLQGVAQPVAGSAAQPFGQQTCVFAPLAVTVHTVPWQQALLMHGSPPGQQIGGAPAVWQTEPVGQHVLLMQAPAQQLAAAPVPQSDCPAGQALQLPFSGSQTSPAGQHVLLQQTPLGQQLAAVPVPHSTPGAGHVHDGGEVVGSQMELGGQQVVPPGGQGMPVTTHWPFWQLSQGPQMSWQAPSAPQLWQALQPPPHTPVTALQVWQSGQTTG